MYLWRRRATQVWWNENEEALREAAGIRSAVIERPDRERIELEVASRSRAQLQALQREFGGRVEELQRDWLQRSLRRKTKPIHVASKRLTIPAGAAFGTGEHVSTSMCLTIMKRIVRAGDVVVDLGTGSGILALAARLLGAKRVLAIDNDPTAIRVAKENARLNKVDNVTFRVADARRWKCPRKSRLRQGSAGQVDLVTANLFSELLIQILPKLGHARRLILSGILREQERDLRHALIRNKIDIVEVQRRGNWVAILARRG